MSKVPDLKFRFADEMAQGWTEIAMRIAIKRPFDMNVGRHNYVVSSIRNSITNEVLCLFYLYRTKTSHVVYVFAIVEYDPKYTLQQ